jgi:hypothetical protein
MLRKLPEDLRLFENVDWLPFDSLARIITRIVYSSFDTVEEKYSGEGVRVSNLVNPSHVRFNSFVPATQKRLAAAVEIVTFDA